MATRSSSPSRQMADAARRYRTCPEWRPSNTPEARIISEDTTNGAYVYRAPSSDPLGRGKPT
jgi:hypothetical protein